MISPVRHDGQIRMIPSPHVTESLSVSAGCGIISILVYVLGYGSV